MALVVTFRVPADACGQLVPGYGTPSVDAASIKAAIKAVLLSGIENGTTPVAVEIPATEKVERINLSLKEGEAMKIRELARTSGIPDSIVCQRLVMGVLANNPGATADIIPAGCEPLEVAWKKTGLHPRPAQAQVYLNIKDAFSDGQVALIEAATGVGKTMAILLAAENRLLSVPDSRVVIAVPTISLIRQYANTYRRLISQGVSMSPMEILFGRREFVSQEVLMDVLDNPNYAEHKERILSWVKLGGEPMPECPYEKPWLVSTLRTIAPGFPAEICAIADITSQDDPGFRAYQLQFQREGRNDKEIILCTHAMLAISTRHQQWSISSDAEYSKMRKAEFAKISELKSLTHDDQSTGFINSKSIRNEIDAMKKSRLEYGAMIGEDSGKIPTFRYLVIDEAHQFESAMSSANSSYLSLKSLYDKAKACHAAGIAVSKAMLDTIKAAIGRVQEASMYTKGDTILLKDEDRAAVLAREAISDLADACTVRRVKKKKLSAKENYLLTQLEYSRIVLRNAINQNSHNYASIKFSPVREYPQVYVGAARVDGLMSNLWACVKAAACVSATLYIPREDGYSSHFQRKLLNVPTGRLKDYPPVAPYWLHDAVNEFHLPISGENAIFPPSRSKHLSSGEFEAANINCLEKVASKITEIRESAVGGTLVLITSYDAIRILRKLLPQDFKDESCVFASLDSTITKQAITFLSMAESGKKPVWFATGAAWTGLDIGGHEPMYDLLGKAVMPAEVDNILTDLVIPRLPFGLNHSITHQYRIKTDPRTPWEILDMLLRLKQGMGRIIRRHGLPKNRRIFLLDSRIYNPGFEFIQEKVMQMCRGYRRVGLD
jgi:CRISPR type IV-associated DEAD/DEAH-box helicase Csf4